MEIPGFVVVLTLILCSARSTIVHDRYTKLAEGQTVTGHVASEVTARSKLQCSDMCSKFACSAYQFSTTGSQNCVLIQENSSGDQNFTTSGGSTVYKKQIIDACSLSPCLNNGVCTVVNDNFTCSCQAGYYGNNCQEFNECHSNPCQNNGNCTDLNNAYNCSCQDGYYGSRCEEADECYSNPCQNSGNCTDLSNAYNCSCQAGYYGDECEEIDECYSSPCQNNGTCIDLSNAFKCNCSIPWGGKTCLINCSIDWCPPVDWPTDLLPVVYRNFQTEERITPQNGAQIVPGKIDSIWMGNAVQTDGIDDVVLLGDLSVACITNPDTCGPEGAAISIWIKIPSTCGATLAGVISSTEQFGTGFAINCIAFPNIRFGVFHDVGFFVVDAPRPTEWFHLVGNYIGSADGEGNEIFIDGAWKARNNVLGSYDGNPGDDNVMVGKFMVNIDGFYSEAEVDELALFNRKLTPEEVQMIYELDLWAQMWSQVG